MNVTRQWTLRTRRLTFGRLPLLMGIVNVTPDSFSDGGQFLDHQRAVEQAERLVEQGADILDVGGESTRPYSHPVDAEEEHRRVIPVIRQIARNLDIPISIDTSKASVAQAALDAGAEIINDVTGLEGDDQMPSVAVRSQAGVCAMHMQGTPQTMQDNPFYQNVVEDIYQYLRQRKEQLLRLGLDSQRICLDPGIGFGKSHQHNMELVRCIERFHQLGQPLLVGHSRKGFLAHIIGNKEADRTAATVGVALQLARAGVQIIRVHDVQPVRHALLTFAVVGGLD